MESSLWTEKYRPQTFSEVKGQKEIVKRIEAFVKQKNLPHLLLSGPPGVGKTTLSLVIVKELYGNEWKENFLELNASVTPDTPILIRQNGKVKRTTFKYLAQHYYKDSKSKYAYPEDLEILCMKKNYDVDFGKVANISRHKTNDIIEIKYEGGSVSTTQNHSIIVLDEQGNPISKQAGELKKGDLLISFVKDLKANQNKISLKNYKSAEYIKLVSGMQRNPTLKSNFDDIPINSENAFMIGLYTAEGCTSLNNKNTGGQVIFSLGYPQEQTGADWLQQYFSQGYNLNSTQSLAGSGFNRSKKSSVQVMVNNTQLVKFLRDTSYSSKKIFNARTKIIPEYIFNTTKHNRWSFLDGYSGDAHGKWGEYLRYSSRSKDLLIDTVWLARISGIESSYQKTESRLLWDVPNHKYKRSDLIPASIAKEILEYTKKGNPRYKLRHQLYGKKSNRVHKKTIRNILENCTNQELKNKISNLIDSGIHSVKIKDIKVKPFKDYVYDVSVPGSENFFGGTMPVLLHNSDERGIDVVRQKVKDFARTKSIGNVPFKIIYLDESDALTREAQQALRRTMENYTQTCRFILSCNYSSKIIEPIQSRCSMFRFKPLNEQEINDIIQEIARKESLQISSEAKKALYEVSGGDVRRLENVLQGAASLSQNIDEKIIYDVSSHAEPVEIRKILNFCISNNFKEAKDQLLNVMLKQGLAGIDVIKQLQSEAWKIDSDDLTKLEIVKQCGDAEFRLIEGSNEFIQLEALLAKIILITNKK